MTREDEVASAPVAESLELPMEPLPDQPLVPRPFPPEPPQGSVEAPPAAPDDATLEQAAPPTTRDDSPSHELRGSNFVFAPPQPRVAERAAPRPGGPGRGAPRRARPTTAPEAQPPARFSDPRHPARAALGLAALVVVGSVALAAAVGAAIVVISLAASAAAG